MPGLDLGPGDDLIAIFAAGGSSLVVGLAIGRWWAPLLAFAWLLAGAVLPDSDMGLQGTLFLVLVMNVPAAASLIALGVAIRRRFGRVDAVTAR
jgi:hypothetical protein